MKILVKWVTRRSSDHFAEFWNPLHISEMAEARNSKFGMQIEREVPCRKKWKFRQKGVARGWRDHFGEFWDPLHISAMAEARNPKFGMQIDREVPYRKNDNFGKMGH